MSFLIGFNLEVIVYGQRIYRVKGNVVTVEDRINQLNSRIETLKKESEAFRLEVTALEDKVDLNLNRISKVMSGTGGSSLNGVSGENGTVLVNDLSLTQKRFIRDLERDNRQFDRDTRKLELKLDDNRELIRECTAESTELGNKLDLFRKSQKKFVGSKAGKKESSGSKTDQSSILKGKLIELKKLFEEGYISKEVYDEKSKELLNELF